VDAQAKKKAAALAACGLVRSGMVVGLGTGSTVQFVLEELARRQKAGERFLGVPTSRRTEDECRALRIPLTTLAEHPDLALTIDGADELDARLHLIKGGGGALLREKVVAAATREVVIVADEAKLVATLGTTFAVPVETVTFAEAPVRRRLEALGAKVSKRANDGRDYLTDNGHLILDARFASIPDPAGLERAIKMTPGVAEVGLFVGLAHRAYVAGDAGVRELRATPPAATKRL
jgi:ribose 5-phosphate isomerase A